MLETLMGNPEVILVASVIMPMMVQLLKQVVPKKWGLGGVHLAMIVSFLIALPAALLFAFAPEKILLLVAQIGGWTFAIGTFLYRQTQ